MKEFEFRADDTREYAVIIALTILNVLGVGLAAGMTLGYTSLDTMRLKIKAEMGTAAEKESVGKVLSLLKNRHQFLCTLLVFNVICAECLPLLMDIIMPKWLSLLLSVSFVLLAGEVIPAGIFTGPQRLVIARRLVDFSKVLQYFFAPIAYPLAKMLDYLVGTEEKEILTRDELMCMMKITRDIGLEIQSRQDRNADDNDDNGMGKESIQMDEKDVLLPEEVKAIRGVLSLTHMKVKELMVAIEDVYMISSSSTLDKETLASLDDAGHSRVPVYKDSNRDFINGFLLVKKLITIDPGEKTPLQNHSSIQRPLYIDASHRAIDMLERFQTGTAHIAIVSENSTKLQSQMRNNQAPTKDCAPKGILTMENILEYILQEPIYDEEDLRKQSISSNHSDNDLMLLSSNTSPYTYMPARHSRIQANQKKYISPHSNNDIYNNNMDHSRIQHTHNQKLTMGGYYGSIVVQNSQPVAGEGEGEGEGRGEEEIRAVVVDADAGDDRNDNEKEPLLSL